jgi:hypothetical protein
MARSPLNRYFTRRAPRRPASRPRHRPWLECLEDRTLLASAPFPGASLLNLGDSPSSVIRTAGQVDTYQIDLPSTVYLRTRVTEPAGDPLLARLSWRGPDGKLLVQSDGASLANPQPEITQYLTPGTYYLQVQGVAGTTGAYTLTTSFKPATAFGFGEAYGYLNYTSTTVAVGDFNGDGIPDVAIGYQGANPDYNYNYGSWVTVYPGIGDGWVGQPIQKFINLGPDRVNNLLVGDFNGDGKLDILATGQQNQEAWMLLGNGDGTFQAPPNADGVPQAPQAFSLAPTGTNNGTWFGAVAGDFTGNGILDVATADGASQDVAVFLGRGDGTFQAPIHVPVPTQLTAQASNTNVISTEQLVAGDFTGDGHTDLATLTVQRQWGYNVHDQGEITILKGNGDGTFHALPQTFTTQTSSNGRTLVAGDFNEDGHTDLALGLDSGDVQLFFGKGDGTFGSPSLVTVDPGQAILVMHALDFNQDGHTDLAIGDMSSQIQVLFGHGDGTFSPGVAPFWVSQYPYDLAAADLNGDGHLDFVAATGANFWIRINRGDNTFPNERPSNTKGDGYFFDPQAVDLNNDGIPDLVALNGQQVSVMLGQGNGSFGTEARYNVLPGNVNGYFEYPLSVVDFNGDGRPDLLFGSFSADYSHYNVTLNAMFLLLGRGDGTFAPAQEIDLGALPPGTGWNYNEVIVGDFNGDGRPDVLVNNNREVYDPSAPVPGTPLEISNTVWIYYSRPDGTLGPPQLIFHEASKTQDRLITFYPGDYNGDGKLDLLLYNSRWHLYPNQFQGQTYWFWSKDPDDMSLMLQRPDGTFAPDQPVQLAPPPSWAYYTSYSSIMTGDFNHDGRTDVAADVYYRSKRVRGHRPHVEEDFIVSLAQADGTFKSLPPVNPQGNNDFWYPQAIADLNGDGIPDLIVADTNTNTWVTTYGIRWGQGDGTFVDSGTQLPVQGTPYALIAADFTGTGRTDIATISSGFLYGNNVYMLQNLGDGKFIDQSTIFTPQRATPRVGDVDGDGVPDVVVTSATGNILFRHGRADQRGTFDPPVLVNPGEPARDAVLVPTDQGTLIAAVSSNRDAVLLYGLKDGSFSLLATLATGSLPAQIAAANLDGDGHTDLAVRNAGSQTVTLYDGDGQGHFTQLLDLATQTSASDVLLADLQGHGATDVAISDFFSGDVTLWRNQGGALFADPSRYRAGVGFYGINNPIDPVTNTPDTVVGSFEQTIGLAAGDVRGNGVTDLLTLNADTRTVGLLAGLGQGRFANPSAFLYSNTPQVLVTGDFNGDGRADLAILGSGVLSIYLSRGDGTFLPPTTIDVGPDATGLSVADINGDGRLDLLVGNRYGDVLVLLGNGDGTFQPYRRAERAMALAVADLSGDGHDDFVLADQGLDRVVVEYGTGQTSFSQDRANGLLSPDAVKLVDLNGDGIPDLVVANGGGNNVMVYLGLGHGQFAPAISYFVGTNPASVTIADINGDGIPDLIIANKGSNDVSILLGQGKGASWSLVPGPRLNAGGIGPVSVTVADVTGPQGTPDGRPDLLVTNSGSNNVTLLPNVGNGFFNDRNPQVFHTGSDPVESIVGNFDGRPGLVSVDAGSNTLTFFPGFSADGITLSSGGLRPVSAVAGDFFGDGHTELLVANNDDGQFALLTDGENGGLALAAAFSVNGLEHPTALALGLDGRTTYATGEGGEWAERVDLLAQLATLDERAALGLREGNSRPGATDTLSTDLVSRFALPLGGPLLAAGGREGLRDVGLEPLSDAVAVQVATLLTGVAAGQESGDSETEAAPNIPPGSSEPQTSGRVAVFETGTGERGAMTVPHGVAKVLLQLEREGLELGLRLSTGSVSLGPAGEANPEPAGPAQAPPPVVVLPVPARVPAMAPAVGGVAAASADEPQPEPAGRNRWVAPRLLAVILLAASPLAVCRFVFRGAVGARLMQFVKERLRNNFPIRPD